jgi:hypothetical protein
VTEQRDIVPNFETFLQAAGQGCVSGRVSEWPQLRPACAYAAVEITRLREQLAASEANREQTVKNWEADIRAMNALRDGLREQLRIARDGLEYMKNGTVPAMVQHLDDTLARGDQEARND